MAGCITSSSRPNRCRKQPSGSRNTANFGKARWIHSLTIWKEPIKPPNKPKKRKESHDHNAVRKHQTETGTPDQSSARTCLQSVDRSGTNQAMVRAVRES